MGRRAMTLLHERVSGTPSETQLIVLPVTIQTRQSSAGYMRISRLEQGAS
jgi:DNA-binding LacI/PurR family transcriptional regulator